MAILPQIPPGPHPAAGGVREQTAWCDYTAGRTTISLAGSPYEVVPTSDGCWLFVSLRNRDPGAQGAVSVLRNEGGGFAPVSTFRLPSNPAGLSLSPDGRFLAVASEREVDVLDVKALEARDARALAGRLSLSGDAGAVNVAFTPDGRSLFVAEEAKGRIGYVDFEQASATGFRHADHPREVAVGAGPVGLAVSADGDRLYATSEIGPPSSRPAGCAPEGNQFGPSANEGAVSVLNVEAFQSAREDPIDGVFPAGCRPVRARLSASGDQLWVTARGGDELLQFDTGQRSRAFQLRLVHAFRTRSSPIGLAPNPHHDIVCFTESMRFDPVDQASVSCLQGGRSATVLLLNPGAFPRSVGWLPDGRTLVVAAFGTGTVEVAPALRP